MQQLHYGRTDPCLRFLHGVCRRQRPPYQILLRHGLRDVAHEIRRHVVRYAAGPGDGFIRPTRWPHDCARIRRGRERSKGRRQAEAVRRPVRRCNRLRHSLSAETVEREQHAIKFPLGCHGPAVGWPPRGAPPTGLRERQAVSLRVRDNQPTDARTAPNNARFKRAFAATRQLSAVSKR
jgi:hypothetical protein